MISHLRPTLDTRPLFSYILPELVFINKRKLSQAELTCVQALYRLFPLGPSAPSSMISHLHLILVTRPSSPSTITRYVSIRETREGWPLLTVGTWNWGEWGHKKDKCKGFFPGWFFGLVVPVQILFVLAALAGPVQNIFSSPYTISMPMSPSPSKLGRQPCWVASLLVCVSGLYLKIFTFSSFLPICYFKNLLLSCQLWFFWVIFAK